MCAYDNHQELVGIPTKSWSEYTMTQQAIAGRNLQPILQPTIKLHLPNPHFPHFKQLKIEHDRNIYLQYLDLHIKGRLKHEHDSLPIIEILDYCSVLSLKLLGNNDGTKINNST